MLAITANWGIGDGSLADSRAGRAATWLDAIRRGVARAGWGPDGRYRPVDEVTLVFAGDTFEWLLSDRWSGEARPWHGGARGEAARADVAQAGIRAARPVLRTVVCWAVRGLAVASATSRGRPSDWAEQSVRIRPVMLAGDRDAWLTDHAAVAARFGIATGDEWFDGQRHVRHGHDLDPLAHRGGAGAGRSGRQPTLGESLIIDLVVRFAVAARADANLWTQVRPSLTRLAATRPSHWPSLVARMAADGRRQGTLGSVWRKAVTAWHRAAVREVPTCETEFDVLGELAAWLDGVAEERAIPDTIRRLERGSAGPVDGVSLVADPDGAESPSLICLRPDGATWRERLGGAPSGPSVVAVGVVDAGGGFIDAA